MKCFNCECAVLKHREAPVSGSIKGEEYTVLTPALVCDKCGYIAMEGADVPEHLRRLADAYRSAHGLLTSDELRSRRNQLGMSQKAFAQYLTVGEASVKRWELGAVQDVALDRYLRLKTDPVEATKNATDVAALASKPFFRGSAHFVGANECLVRQSGIDPNASETLASKLKGGADQPERIKPAGRLRMRRRPSKKKMISVIK